MLNYVHALEYGLERLDTLPVSLRLMRELHERLVTGTRGEHLTPGEFRRSQNWIGPHGSTINSATYVPPPVEEMNQALYAIEQITWHERVQSAKGAGTMHSVVDMLLERPILATSDLTRCFDITYPTARNTLSRLQDLGIVNEYTGKKRNQRFLASEIMDVLTL